MTHLPDDLLREVYQLAEQIERRKRREAGGSRLHRLDFALGAAWLNIRRRIRNGRNLIRVAIYGTLLVALKLYQRSRVRHH